MPTLGGSGDGLSSWVLTTHLGHLNLDPNCGPALAGHLGSKPDEKYSCSVSLLFFSLSLSDSQINIFLFVRVYKNSLLTTMIYCKILLLSCKCFGLWVRTKENLSSFFKGYFHWNWTFKNCIINLEFIVQQILSSHSYITILKLYNHNF